MNTAADIYWNSPYRSALSAEIRRIVRRERDRFCNGEASAHQAKIVRRDAFTFWHAFTDRAMPSQIVEDLATELWEDALYFAQADIADTFRVISTGYQRWAAEQ